MHLESITTGKLQEHDDLALAIANHSTIEHGDIIAISAKVIAYTEGAKINVQELLTSPEAEQWHTRLTHSNHSIGFRQAVLNETKRMNGKIVDACPQVMLCELQPNGMTSGKTILAVNAGLDASNIEPGYAIGWPVDPVASVRRLYNELHKLTQKDIGVLITDSCCVPRRWGVSAMALTVHGFTPITSEVGKPDLFGRTMHMTSEATADQLATAANFLMGNAAQATPAVCIKNHNIPLAEYNGWVPGMDPAEDIFQGMFRAR